MSRPGSRPSNRSRRPVLLVVLATAGAVAALAGCDTGDGRELSAPPPGATVATQAPAPSSSYVDVIDTPPVGSGETGLVLASDAFAEGGEIPVRYGCEGDNISPPLAWSGVPVGTVELALTVTDPDAPDGRFVHWVVTGLDANLVGIDEGILPEGAVEARNDTTEFGWFGPCPPSGTQQYVFTLHALSAPSGVSPGAGGDEALAQIAATPGVAAQLTGTYSTPPANG